TAHAFFVSVDSLPITDRTCLTSSLSSSFLQEEPCLFVLRITVARQTDRIALPDHYGSDRVNDDDTLTLDKAQWQDVWLSADNFLRVPVIPVSLMKFPNLHAYKRLLLLI